MRSIVRPCYDLNDSGWQGLMDKGELIGSGRQAEVYAWGKDHALKLFFEWNPAERVENEAGAQSMVHTAGLPAPAVDEVVHLGNKHGIIMERISGPTMLSVLLKQPWRLRELMRVLAEFQARLHAARIQSLQAAPLSLRETISRVGIIPLPLKRSLMKMLASLPDGEAVCHYDLHPLNIIMSPRGPVIIDWATVKKGNPILDVARTWILLTVSGGTIHFPRSMYVSPLRAVGYRAYLRQYNCLCPVDAGQFACWRHIIAAARLGEAIPAEERILLRLLKSVRVDRETRAIA